MIKINLAPQDALDNPWWFVGDIAAVVGIYAAIFLLISTVLETKRESTNEINQQIEALNRDIQQISPEVAKYKNLDSEIKTLNSKLSAMKSITMSKSQRFRAVIILEHIHNLKPEGVWFRKVSIDTPLKNDLKITGAAFDNILIAEFMAALKSTSITEADSTDVRTMIAFSDVAITTTTLSESDGSFPDLKNVYTFDLEVKVEDRSNQTSSPALAGFYAPVGLKDLYIR